MSGHSAPETKLSLRKRIRNSFRSRSRAPSPSPSPSLSTHVLTTQRPALFSSAVVAAANPPNTSTGHTVSQRVTSQPSGSHGIFSQALQLLSESDRTVLQDYIPTHASDITLALQQALAATKEKQRHCDEQRWTFTFKGRIVTLKEEADKVTLWLDRFKAVGDVAINADPVHAGLPWAGIRLLLQV